MHSSVGRHTSPESTQGGRCQHGDNCIDMISQETSNAVPGLHTGFLQSIGTLPYPFSQLLPRDILTIQFGCRDHRHRIFIRRTGWVEKILRKVQPATGEEGWSREQELL